jgi:hypothetical protein
VLKGQAMRAPVLLFVALAAGAIGAPATAAPTCLLEVDSKRYLDGLCTVTEDGSGSWLIVRDRLSGQAATVKVNPILSGRGDAVWAGPSGDGRLSEALGSVRREGSCWVNTRARICAWGYQ